MPAMRLGSHLIVSATMALSVATANAQGAASTAAAALNRVISYRHSWLGDTTRVDACGAFEALGRPSAFPAGLPDPQNRLLDTDVQGCVEGRLSPAAQAAGRFAYVDSISTTDSTATVILIVRRGEYTHRETYALAGGAGRSGLGITNVTLWGATQSTAPARQPLPLTLEERAQALEDVIRTRYISITDAPAVDLCSVFFALDRDPRFQDRLSAYARSKLSAGSVESCPASAREQRQENGWYVRDFVRSGPDELSVVTAKNGHGGHRETYVMYHGYGDRKLWRVHEVRISDFWYE
jgi:hypothetical protein